MRALGFLLVGLTVAGASAAAHALSCIPPEPDALMQDPEVAIIVGTVHTVEEINESVGRGNRATARYAVKVERSWKQGPFSGEIIQVRGYSVGPWAAPLLEPIPSGYLMVLNHDPHSDDYFFNPCSKVEIYTPAYEWFLALNDAAINLGQQRVT